MIADTPIKGFKLSQVLNNRLSTVRSWYEAAKGLGLKDDAEQTALVTILEKGDAANASAKPIYYMSGLVSHALERLVKDHRKHTRNPEDAGQVQLSLQDGTWDELTTPPIDPLTTPEDPFELIDESDRDLVRDYYYAPARGSGRSTEGRERSGLSKRAYHKRVVGAIQEASDRVKT